MKPLVWLNSDFILSTNLNAENIFAMNLKIPIVAVLLLLVWEKTVGQERLSQINSWTWTWAANDYQILQRVAMLEARQTLLEGTVAEQKAEITNLSKRIEDMKQRTWGSWGEWGQCDFSCNRSVTEGARVQTRFRNMTAGSVVLQTETDQRPCNAVQFADMKQRTWGSWGEWGQCNFSCKRGVTEGARVQTRFRNMTVDSVVMQTETDQRPCNSVQFAGCDKSSSADDNYATAFSFTDEIAQATCTAIRSEGGFVRAVRRTCSNQAVSCEDLCKSLSATCFNALHVYQPTNVLGRTETGKAGLKTYRYNSCSGSKCGPNFCCCTGDYTK
ncbi:hypothetical protein DPMN_105942 [Dreissena polymorpha]|uniref:Uncharacterized protein n=1 Tax=Dreissena polymorpha TaxID=45954 RepID=A0A9D4QJ72_DREPO|nr:hypothetical protein DPMN_105942 [Dreissena polymorpha]